MDRAERSLTLLVEVRVSSRAVFRHELCPTRRRAALRTGVMEDTQIEQPAVLQIGFSL